MSVPALSLAVEAVVSILLVVTIVYAARLNRRLTDLRGQEAELQDGIARFNEAAARAEAAATRLKSVGAEAERAVRAALDRAQAVRDELMFLADRGDAAARGMANAAKPSEPRVKERLRGSASVDRPPDVVDSGKKPRAERQLGARVPDDAVGGALRSAAERELLKAIRAAHGAR